MAAKKRAASATKGRPGSKTRARAPTKKPAPKPAPLPLGRPTYLTPELAAQIVRETEAGVPLCDVAAIVGVGLSTLVRWRRDGAREDAPEAYQAFRLALEKARAKARANSIRAIRKAGEKSWQAHAWFLERSDPARWAMKHQIQAQAQSAFLGLLTRIRGLVDDDTYRRILAAGLGVQSSVEGSAAAPSAEEAR